MATANDWETRTARVKEQFTIQLPALITSYEMKTRAVGDLINQMKELEGEKGRLQHEIVMAEQDASTSDRKFIEQKETMSDPFKPSKIYTIQDFTFFFFFLSYCIFVVALSMAFQEKIKTLITGIVALFFITILMFRYI